MLTKQRLPIFKSDIQAKILAELLLNTEEERTVGELVRVASTHISNVKNEADPLVENGFLLSRKQGRNRLLKANLKHPLFEPMRQILMYAYGPPALLPKFLKDVAGVQEAWIYGSWARRYLGEHTGTVGDLDVLLIGEGISNSEMYAAAAEAEHQLRIETNFHKLTPERFATAEDAFTVTVRESPRVKIELGDN